jgi:hypothetical protein
MYIHVRGSFGISVHVIRKSHARIVLSPEPYHQALYGTLLASDEEVPQSHGRLIVEADVPRSSV